MAVKQTAGIVAFCSAVLLCLTACESSSNVYYPVPSVEIVESNNEAQFPDKKEQYISISGVEYPIGTDMLRPGKEAQYDELKNKVSDLPLLRSVDLRQTELTSEQAVALSQEFPYIEFVWKNILYGRNLPSYSEEIDISGIPVEDLEALEKELKFFPELKRVIMSDCGISNEEMCELNHRHEDIRFIWTVHFSVYSLRTDAKYFCASDLPSSVAPELYNEQIDPIKYCTDLEVLDLGHMNYSDLSFLKEMTKMKSLILVQGKFSDISVLSNMPDLVFLELFNNNRITDATPLLNCKKLKDLNLGYCAYLDCSPLKEMKQLERLWLPHVLIPNIEKEELKQALPNTEVYFPIEDPMGSTGHGWREKRSYYDMRDALHMYYLPGGTGMN